MSDAAADFERFATRDPTWVRRSLLAIALLFLGVALGLPVAVVLVEAFRPGIGPWLEAITTDDSLSAIALTLQTVAIVVPVNVVLGVATAWALGRFRFRGRSVLISLLDLPLAVSPVIAGMSFVLLLGVNGVFGETITGLGLEIIFAPPGIFLATTFVTYPFVARELIPFWEAQGSEEEEAALVLGASGPTLFRRISLPNAKWAVLYGVVLTASRAMGEFGAVSVVSGHIRGVTTTMPLQVEVLYGDNRFSQAFAVASLLIFAGSLNLVAKKLLERRVAKALKTKAA